jgi:4-hydroxy-2-oxoheptanedioate aldolase
MVGMSGEKAKKRLQQGFDMVSIVTDTDTLIWGLTKQLEDVKA